MNAEDLLGVWKLISWVQEYDDGRSQHLFGERPEGLLIYSVGGYMSGTMQAGGRKNLSKGQWTSPPEEAAAAYVTFLGYAGRFTIDGNDVIHHIEVSSFPNWAGVDQRRHASLDDGVLRLVTGRIEAGTSESRTATLTWRRA